MARKPSDLRRIQASQSKADAAWWDSVCGPEEGKLFRDQSALADLVLPSHWHYLDHIEDAGLKPVRAEKEVHRRVALSMRSEHYEHALMHIGEGAAYPDNAAFLSDLTRTARLLVAGLEELLFDVGEERVHDRVKAIHPVIGRDRPHAGFVLSAEEFLDALRSEDAPRALEELLHKAWGGGPTYWPQNTDGGELDRREPTRERKHAAASADRSR